MEFARTTRLALVVRAGALCNAFAVTQVTAAAACRRRHLVASGALGFRETIVGLLRGRRDELRGFDDRAIGRRGVTPLERALKCAASQLVDDVRQPFLRDSVARFVGPRFSIVFRVDSHTRLALLVRAIIGDALYEKTAALRGAFVTLS
jgi:hypothetical protein